MQKKLPSVLQQEPLVDAVFEVRFKDSPPLADFLPGFLFSVLDPKPELTRLPAADIPYPMRANDPSLKFTPIQRLEWGQYFVLVGDQSVVISCKLPYPKWPKFKAAIIKIIQHIETADIVGQIERYSIKYVNLIQAPTFAEQIQKIRVAIKLGDDEVKDNQMSLNVHRKEEDFLHILSIVIGAKAQMLDGKQIFGVVVDIDSIRTINAPDFGTFFANLEQGLEELRRANKEKFFNCLTDAAIEDMEPIYE